MTAELGWLDGFIDDWKERHPAVVAAVSAESSGGATTPLHRPTIESDPAKHLQRIKPPKAE